MANTWEAFSRELEAAVDAARPRVVRVEARRRRASTGFVLNGGEVVTASHAVERDEDVRVSLDGERTVPAELVGRDPATDVALLRIDAGAAQSPEALASAGAWTDADAVKVGSLVLALARPGRSVRAGVGIISAVADGWRNPAGSRLERYVEADVTMRPGFSGAPLVDARGGLVGMATTGLVPGSVMVIPAANLRAIATELKASGGIRRGYLGIGSHPIRLQGAARAAANADFGLLVFSVEPDGPAERGGVLVGDVLLAVDGKPTRQIEDLLAALTHERVGKAASLQLLRAGARTDLDVTIGARS